MVLAVVLAIRWAGRSTDNVDSATDVSPSEVVAQWRPINFVDEFGDVTDRGASSAEVSPIRRMSFPYGNVTARIVVNCDRAWIRFSDAPNLTGGRIGDGYTRHNVAVRVDGNDVGRWRVRQSWGDKDLSIRRQLSGDLGLGGGHDVRYCRSVVRRTFCGVPVDAGRIFQRNPGELRLTRP